MEENKKLIVGIVVFFTVLICVLLVITNIDKMDKKDETNSIKDITFRGFSLGEKYHASEHIIFDAEYEYLEKEIGISTDKNGVIYYLCFFSTFDKDGNRTNSIEKARIKYKGNILKTYDDFIKYFEEGSVHRVEGSDLKKIKYVDGNVTLTLTLRSEELINIELEEEFN